MFLQKDKGDTVDSEHESDSHSKTNEVTEHVRPKKKGKTKKQYVRKTNTEYARSVVLEDEEWETATEYIEKHKILYDRGMAGKWRHIVIVCFKMNITATSHCIV